MNSWDDHNVTFETSEGLTHGETSVRVLDEDASPEERTINLQDRAVLLSDNDMDPAIQFQEREKLTSRMKRDPAYKFLMMVAAFSSTRMNKLVKLNTHQQTICGDVCTKISTPDVDFFDVPEISGIIHLSSAVYGHMKEAETILRKCHVNIPLKSLVENMAYSTMFARLVAIRMSLTSTIASSSFRLDGTFRRLHEEQHMVLNTFKKLRVESNKFEWTRPLNAY
jgi:hypothetical protein